MERSRVEPGQARGEDFQRSEEHTSELQSPCNLVCRLLLEKKKTTPPRPQRPQHQHHLQTTSAVDCCGRALPHLNHSDFAHLSDPPRECQRSLHWHRLTHTH